VVHKKVTPTYFEIEIEQRDCFGNDFTSSIIAVKGGHVEQC